MKKLLKYILIFISYFIYSTLIKLILYYFNINFYSFDIKYKILITFLIELSYIIIIILLYRKELKEEIIAFKDKFKEYIPKYLIIYLIGIALMGISNIIISKITNSSLAGNEITIREYIQKYPLYMLFSSVIYAPIIEELIFRKTLKNILKYKYLFIISSGLIFGLLHISEPSLKELLFSIPYIIMGIDFAYIYYKTNNIFTTITFHLCHNLILLIIQLL